MKGRQLVVLVAFLIVAVVAIIGTAMEVLKNTPIEFIIVVLIFAFVLFMGALAFMGRTK